MTTVSQPQLIASAFEHNVRSLTLSPSAFAVMQESLINRRCPSCGIYGLSEFTRGVSLHTRASLAPVSGIPGAGAFSLTPSAQPRNGEVLPVGDRQPGFYS